MRVGKQKNVLPQYGINWLTESQTQEKISKTLQSINRDRGITAKTVMQCRSREITSDTESLEIIKARRSEGWVSSKRARWRTAGGLDNCRIAHLWQKPLGMHPSKGPMTSDAAIILSGDGAELTNEACAQWARLVSANECIDSDRDPVDWPQWSFDVPSISSCR